MKSDKNKENPLEEPRYVDISDSSDEETEESEAAIQAWAETETPEAKRANENEERQEISVDGSDEPMEASLSRKRKPFAVQYPPPARNAPNNARLRNNRRSPKPGWPVPPTAQQSPQNGRQLFKKPNRAGVPEQTKRKAAAKAFPQKTTDDAPTKMLPAEINPAFSTAPLSNTAHNSSSSSEKMEIDETQETGMPQVTVSAQTLMPEWYLLEELIDKHQPLPEGSVILGVDDEGKPLVISLEDASFGSLLFLGDSAAANRKHLLSVLASAEMLNQPEILQIDVITPKPDGFASKKSNLRTICNVSENCVYDLLGDYLNRLEERLRDEKQLPFLILVLDQLDTLVDQLAEESLRFLRWIIRRGPQAGIWPLASIQSGELVEFDLKTYKSFGFHLYGKITEAKTVQRFTQMPANILQSLSPGSQGCFMLEEDVISFSIPEVAQ